LNADKTILRAIGWKAESGEWNILTSQ